MLPTIDRSIDGLEGNTHRRHRPTQSKKDTQTNRHRHRHTHVHVMCWGKGFHPALKPRTLQIVTLLGCTQAVISGGAGERGLGGGKGKPKGNRERDKRPLPKPLRPFPPPIPLPPPPIWLAHFLARGVFFFCLGGGRGNTHTKNKTTTTTTTTTTREESPPAPSHTSQQRVTMNRLASIPPRTLPVVQHGLFQAVDEGLGPEDVAVVGAEGDLFLGGCCMYIQIRGVKKGKRGSVFGGGGRAGVLHIYTGKIRGVGRCADVCVGGHPSTHPPTHPPIDWSINGCDPSIHPPIIPPTHPSIDQTIHPSIHPSTHLLYVSAHKARHLQASCITSSSIHRLIHPSIHPSIRLLCVSPTYLCITSSSTHPSIRPSIEKAVTHTIDQSSHHPTPTTITRQSVYIPPASPPGRPWRAPGPPP